MDKENLHIGTCSWKYDSWQGLIYSAKKPANYLMEYSRHFNTVEVDQWFWSLFAGDTAVLPKPSVVREYAESVPEDFTFGIKVPNSITLTHYYKKNKKDPLVRKLHFLSAELMSQFLQSLSPLSGKIGPLIFQFEYLNKQKVKDLQEFIGLFGEFARKLPEEYVYCVETRNPNYLCSRYFDFLLEQNLHHVFLQGYYMPSIFDIYKKFCERIKGVTVIRLHGPDRGEIEKQTRKDWSRIVAPKENELQMLAEMLRDLRSRQVDSFLYVNNHFEGSAPRTIARIEEVL